MIPTPPQGNAAFVGGGAVFAPWAADAQAEITALYQSIEGGDPNDATTVSWTWQLIAGSAS